MEEYWQGKREWRTGGRVLAGEKGMENWWKSTGRGMEN